MNDSHVTTAAPALYGAIRIPQVEAARAEAAVLRIGVVQVNMSIERKYDQKPIGSDIEAGAEGE